MAKFSTQEKNILTQIRLTHGLDNDEFLHEVIDACNDLLLMNSDRYKEKIFKLKTKEIASELFD